MTDLGLPTTLAGLGYTVTDANALGKAAHRSHFNASAPFHPSAEEYASMIAASARPLVRHDTRPPARPYSISPFRRRETV